MLHKKSGALEIIVYHEVCRQVLLLLLLPQIIRHTLSLIECPIDF